MNINGVKKYFPAVPGREGAFNVVAGGVGILANWLNGKRVGCGGRSDSDETRAEYVLGQ